MKRITLLTLACLSSICLSANSVADALMHKSADYDQPYQQQALEIYRTIIGMRSAAGHGLVPQVGKYLAKQFRKGGFDKKDIHLLPHSVPSGEETAVLIVRYRGDGSSGKKPVLLVAHMDVVDALPKDWERDPFTLIEENGYFFGRGSLDDKFGITTLTSSFLQLRSRGYVPGRDFIIAFSGDEETSMSSTHALVTEHRELTDAEFALNADGGGGELGADGQAKSYTIQTSEKTYASFELTVPNPGGHSSAPRNDNAIYELAAVLGRVQAHKFPVRSNETTRQYFRTAAEQTEGALGAAMARFAADPTDKSAAKVLGQVPGYVGLTRTTCVATLLQAGHAENALPQSATTTINCRIFPGEKVEDVAATLLQVADDPKLTLKTLGTPVASPASPLREDVLSAIAAGVQRIHPGVPIVPYMAPYGTDGKEIRAAGIPTYGVMSLFINHSEVFAHGLNERVPVKSFYDGLEFWPAVLKHLGG